MRCVAASTIVIICFGLAAAMPLAGQLCRPHGGAAAVADAALTAPSSPNFSALVPWERLADELAELMAIAPSYVFQPSSSEALEPDDFASPAISDTTGSWDRIVVNESQFRRIRRLPFGIKALLGILAHEYTHLRQFEIGAPTTMRPVECELHGDFVAGYVLAVTASDQRALETLIRVARDFGADTLTHGRGTQREAAMRAGWRASFMPFDAAYGVGVSVAVQLADHGSVLRSPELAAATEQVLGYEEERSQTWFVDSLGLRIESFHRLTNHSIQTVQLILDWRTELVRRPPGAPETLSWHTTRLVLPAGGTTEVQNCSRSFSSRVYVGTRVQRTTRASSVAPLRQPAPEPLGRPLPVTIGC